MRAWFCSGLVVPAVAAHAQGTINFANYGVCFCGSQLAGRIPRVQRMAVLVDGELF